MKQCQVSYLEYIISYLANIYIIMGLVNALCENRNITRSLIYCSSWSLHSKFSQVHNGIFIGQGRILYFEYAFQNQIIKIREATAQNLLWLSKFILSISSNTCATQLSENDNFYSVKQFLLLIIRNLCILNMDF